MPTTTSTTSTPPRATTPQPTRPPKRPSPRPRTSNALVARQRLACPGAAPPCALHGCDARGLPLRLVDPGARRRPECAAVAVQRRRHPHAAQPVFRFGAVALLDLRA